MGLILNKQKLVWNIKKFHGWISASPLISCWNRWKFPILPPCSLHLKKISDYDKSKFNLYLDYSNYCFCFGCYFCKVLTNLRWTWWILLSNSEIFMKFHPWGSLLSFRQKGAYDLANKVLTNQFKVAFLKFKVETSVWIKRILTIQLRIKMFTRPWLTGENYLCGLNKGFCIGSWVTERFWSLTN